MEYIKFIVDNQRLNYNSRCYVSTDTIDTLFCSFKFEIDGSGNARGGWSLPYLWAQFHDEKGNVWVKPVNDNVCSIPSECLRQPEFKMTLFATDTEDYMVCKKRYTTNEVSFKFKGLANLNYDGGVDPDEPPHTHWEIILERVVACEDKIKTCENTADKLSQDMSVMGDKVDNMSQDVSTMGDEVDGFDGRIADNANAIEKTNTNVEELNAGLGAESKAREDADARLEGLIGDRYTKAETNALVGNESSARATADADLQTAIQEEVNARSEAIDNLNSTVNGLSTNLAEESAARGGADTRLEKLINDESTARASGDARLEELVNAESTTRTNADTNLQSQIAGVSNDLSAETTTRADGDANLQSQIDAIVSQSDVVDIVGTYQELVNYDTTHLTENDVVKVLSDSTHDDGKTYYRWSHGAWSYVGTEGVNYTKAETDRLVNAEATARGNADSDLQSLITDEVAAREKADTNLQSLIDDRYTKAKTDTLIGNEATARASADENLQSSIDDEVTARENADSGLQSSIDDETNERISGDEALQQSIDGLDTRESEHYNDCLSKTSSLDSRVTSNTNAIDGINTTVGGLSTRLANESTSRADADARLEGLIGDEKTARENADANLQSLINNMYTKAETDTLVDAKQDKLNSSQLAAVNSGLTSSDKTTLDGLDSRVTANTNDIAALDAQVEELKGSAGGGSAFLSVESDGVYINYTK